jgi:hypothetical protein
MFGRHGRIFASLGIFLLLFYACVVNSFAQAGTTAVLSTPDISDFPSVTAYLDVHGPDGEFIHGLTPQQVTVIEDTTSLPVSEIHKTIPGVQFVIAVSPGESFLIRDTEGISRYEYFLSSFLSGSWASRPVDNDDYSLITSGGPQLAHSADPVRVKSLLEAYQPAAENIVPGLEILSSALQVASDPIARPGMERAILFITPPQESDVSIGLQSIIASANQQNIHIFVWALAAADVLESPSVDQLRNLAEQTGGAFWSFAHDETIPDLEALLDPLHYVYLMEYTSQINTPGSHQLSAQVATESGTITSQVQAFDVELQPPAVTLRDLPPIIVRSLPAQTTPGPVNDASALLPESQPVSILVEYPDGYEHNTVSTRLYADGTVVAENTSEPFDKFTWNLQSYTQNGEHSLFAEATDNLGLVGRSRERSVKILTPSTTQGMMAAITQKRPLMIAALVIVSASLLVLGLIVGGHIRPKPHPGQRKLPARNGLHTQPINHHSSTRNPRGVSSSAEQSHQNSTARSASLWARWFDRLALRKQKTVPTAAMAYLSPLDEHDEPTIPAQLEIIEGDISLGSDPHQASLVINDPSIQGVHARIHCDQHVFTISDNQTVAGTWVNYIPSSAQGTVLEHMDIVHLGRIGFRFQLAKPGPLRNITVTPLEN